MQLNERGLRDGLAALADIRRTLSTQANTAALEAETCIRMRDDLSKLIGFVDQQIDDYRAQLKQLQDAQ